MTDGSLSSKKSGKAIILAAAALLAFFGMLVFLLPMTMGIATIGGAAGLTACLIILLICAFNNAFMKIIKLLWNKSVGKIVLVLFSVIIIAGIITVSAFSVLMIKAMNDFPEKPSTVIVLGCKINGEAPSRMLRHRLDTAEKYLKENPDIICIVSGGQGGDEIIPEAAVMKNYLVARGIDEDRILVEDKSKSTYENLKFSKKLMDENKLGNNVTIITDGYHQFRAGMLTSEAGFVSNAVSAQTDTYLLPTYWVREWFGIAKELFL